jgi:hypothetical protein
VAAKQNSPLPFGLMEKIDISGHMIFGIDTEHKHSHTIMYDTLFVNQQS